MFNLKAYGTYLKWVLQTNKMCLVNSGWKQKQMCADLEQTALSSAPCCSGWFPRAGVGLVSGRCRPVSNLSCLPAHHSNPDRCVSVRTPPPRPSPDPSNCTTTADYAHITIPKSNTFTMMNAWPSPHLDLRTPPDFTASSMRGLMIFSVVSTRTENVGSTMKSMKPFKEKNGICLEAWHLFNQLETH